MLEGREEKDEMILKKPTFLCWQEMLIWFVKCDEQFSTVIY